MKQRELEIKLQQLKGFENPKASLEQYATPANIAADILYTAHSLGDIEDMRVIDLGCGTGVFSIGACMLGAIDISGTDIDHDAIAIARKNAENAGCHVSFDCLAIEHTQGDWDTCIMNPPFGSQNKHADLPFLDKAFEISKVVYSLHNSETMTFLRRRIEKAGYILDIEKNYKFEIRHTFEFHRREKMNIDVTMLRVVRE